MNTASRCTLDARSRLSAPRPTKGLRNRIKNCMPPRVRSLSYGPRGFFDSVALVSHQCGCQARYSDSIGRLKVVVCTASQHRVALSSDFHGYAIGAASRVVMLRLYAGRPPRWVEVNVKARLLGRAIETTGELRSVVANQSAAHAGRMGRACAAEESGLGSGLVVGLEAGAC